MSIKTECLKCGGGTGQAFACRCAVEHVKKVRAEQLVDGIYWVKWADGQDWDVGAHWGGRWYAIGTEERQDTPEVVGPMPEEPK